MIIWSSELKEIQKLFESIEGQFPELDKEKAISLFIKKTNPKKPRGQLSRIGL